jgi:hypothetical protein
MFSRGIDENILDRLPVPVVDHQAAITGADIGCVT